MASRKVAFPYHRRDELCLGKVPRTVPVAVLMNDIQKQIIVQNRHSLAHRAVPPIHMPRPEPVLTNERFSLRRTKKKRRNFAFLSVPRQVSTAWIV